MKFMLILFLFIGTATVVVDNNLTWIHAFSPITTTTTTKKTIIQQQRRSTVERAALTLLDVLSSKEHRRWIFQSAVSTSTTQLNAVVVKEESTEQEGTGNKDESSESNSISNNVTDTATTIEATTTTTTSLSSLSASSSSSSIIQQQEDTIISPIPVEDLEKVLEEVEKEAEKAVDEMMDEQCEFDPITGGPVDEICVDPVKRKGFRATLKGYINKSLQIVRGKDEDTVVTPDEVRAESTDCITAGELLEQGWEQRASSSSLRRNAEIWKFALKAVFRVLKPRKMKSKGVASEEEIRIAQIDAATFIRDGLLTLGPSFVKLGQVASTRTDVLPKTYTDVLRTLTDEVPGFSGERAKQIVAKELGVNKCEDIFQKFSSVPLKAASLGQVHTAMYKGKKVAVKVQRAGLKELFDTDLKSLKKLAVLLEKFDPKSDGADRDWVKIYEESERQLYLEIDYLNEMKNTERFRADFQNVDYVKIPAVYKELTTPRVLTMEFVESIKMTDIPAVEAAKLDRKLLAKLVADTFLRQIIETSYFHCDPHSGNLCCNKEGQLVFYDFGQMDELKSNVRQGLRTFCTALFKGGPTISDAELARNAKELVRGVEQAGVLSKNADRLAVEKLARYFMRSFKDNQLGKKRTNIKETLGADLQTLTDNNSFRFPATFTFVFRAFVSIEGIGKDLDPEFDLGKLAQPFIQKFIDDQKGYKSQSEKNIDIFSKATGLNVPDINTAISQPKKVAYIEETIRAMETGNLKIRVRSLENEKALERMNLRIDVLETMVVAALLFNIANLIKSWNPIIRTMNIGAAAFFVFQAFMSQTKVKKFDKKQAKYVSTDFVEVDSADE